MNHSQALWRGVFPSLTTSFHQDGRLDVGATSAHAAALLEAGASGLVIAAGLGEGSSLSEDERESLLASCRKVSQSAALLCGVAETDTGAALKQISQAERCGMDGILLRPLGDCPRDYLYETLGETNLAVMLYSNSIDPGAVKIELELIAEILLTFKNVSGIKESSLSRERFRDLCQLKPGISVFVGLDPMIDSAIEEGASGWISGLANAFPAECCLLWNALVSGTVNKAEAMHKFKDIFELDLYPDFVGQIKWLQRLKGQGNGVTRSSDQAIGEKDKLRLQALAGQDLNL